MQYPRQPPLLYYDIWQKSTLFVSGALVGESPHGLEGSCIYLSLIYSKYNIHGMTVYHFFLFNQLCGSGRFLSGSGSDRLGPDSTLHSEVMGTTCHTRTYKKNHARRSRIKGSEFEKIFRLLYRGAEHYFLPNLRIRIQNLSDPHITFCRIWGSEFEQKIFRVLSTTVLLIRSSQNVLKQSIFALSSQFWLLKSFQNWWSTGTLITNISAYLTV
jgi:hypothetical protein